MALIKCSECGKEISDSATTCIHCGCPINAVEKSKYCSECGSKLKDSDTVCGNCGCPVTPNNANNTIANNNYNQMPNTHNTYNEKNNTFCLVGFVVALISLFLNLWGIVGIAAVILSVIGLNQINQTKEKGKGMAIAGICIGIFSIIYAVFQLLYYYS